MNFNSSAVRQYRIMASRADDPLDIPCDLIAPADPGAVAVCANLESSVNYSVRVAAEGFEIGSYSQPVFIVHERNGTLLNKPAILALTRSAFLSFVLFFDIKWSACKRARRKSTLKKCIDQGSILLNLYKCNLKVSEKNSYRKIPKISPSMYKPFQI